MSTNNTPEPRPVALIDNWHVLTTGAVCGIAKNRMGHADGRTIVTSPVKRMERTSTGAAVAVTHSESRYLLGQIAPGHNALKTAEFLREMLRPLDEQPTVPMGLPMPGATNDERTQIFYAADMLVERIELDGTSFAPLAL